MHFHKICWFRDNFFLYYSQGLKLLMGVSSCNLIFKGSDLSCNPFSYENLIQISSKISWFNLVQTRVIILNQNSIWITIEGIGLRFERIKTFFFGLDSDIFKYNPIEYDARFSFSSNWIQTRSISILKQIYF